MKLKRKACTKSVLRTFPEHAHGAFSLARESISRVEVATLNFSHSDLSLSEQFAVILWPSDVTKREKEFPKDFAHYPYK